MNQFTLIKYQTDGQVAVISLNRPEVLNAFNGVLRHELPVALRDAAEDQTIRAVVLTGAGRAFCAGADLKEVDRNIEMTSLLMNQYKPSFDEIVTMEKPVISAIVGSAAGIGLSLALVCDLSVMADDAFLLCPFSTISLIPDGGGSYLLSRQMGYKQAYEMAIEASRLPASRALEVGLVNRLAPAEEVLDSAVQWARKLCERAPLSLAQTKKIMRFAMENSYEATFREEARIQQKCSESEDFAEGRSAFLEKRRPDFKGR